MTGERERFDDYVERCLYDPVAGFYAGGGGTAGRARGDFITSPETGPLFADVLARAIDGWWQDLGRPARLTVVDAGTGPGTLARHLAAAEGPAAAARTVVGVDHDDPLPDDLDGAVVIANELLDNLPFRVLERTEDGWAEWWVSGGHSASPRAELVPVDGRPATGPDRHRDAVITALDRAGDTWPPGTRVPLLDRAAAWVADVLERGAALVVAFDYGAPTTAELAQRGGWLRTYRQHDRGDDPFHQPGHWDITTDVAVDQLPPPSAVTTQADFLRHHGIDELVAEGRRHWTANAARPDLRAMRMRSRISEAEALTDEQGLGSWLALSWHR
ncbi:MAG: SAM-dependent methyltransferase [Actinomycetota bacterium]